MTNYFKNSSDIRTGESDKFTGQNQNLSDMSDGLTHFAMSEVES